mgnify:CR=1 FL=1
MFTKYIMDSDFIHQLLDSIKGPQGPQGDIGLTGNTGPEGLQGRPGCRGPPGKPGPAGEEGIIGPAGERGDKGGPGLKGPEGLLGPPGFQGDRGEQGTGGKEGPVGELGDQGKIGLQGPKGPIGTRGDRGNKGVSLLLTSDDLWTAIEDYNKTGNDDIDLKKNDTIKIESNDGVWAKGTNNRTQQTGKMPIKNIKKKLNASDFIGSTNLMDGFKRENENYKDKYNIEDYSTQVSQLELIDPDTGNKIKYISNKYEQKMEVLCPFNSYLSSFGIKVPNVKGLLTKNIDLHEGQQGEVAQAKFIQNNFGIPYNGFYVNCNSI